MSRIKLIVIVLLAVAAVQLMLLLGLTLLFYQVTPKSTIIQTTFIGRMQSILAGIRLADHSLDFLYRGSPPPEKLPQYRIDIDAEDLAKLEEEIFEQVLKILELAFLRYTRRKFLKGFLGLMIPMSEALLRMSKALLRIKKHFME